MNIKNRFRNNLCCEPTRKCISNAHSCAQGVRVVKRKQIVFFDRLPSERIRNVPAHYKILASQPTKHCKQTFFHFHHCMINNITAIKEQALSTTISKNRDS